MNTARIVATCVVGLSMIGCATGLKRYSPARVVTRPPFVTYFVLNGDFSKDAAVDRDLEQSIESTLSDYGLLKASPEDAQAVVVVHTATAAKRTRSELYRSWGGWGWRTDDEQQRAKTAGYKSGSVVIDVFDAWSKELLTQAVAANVLSASSKARDDAVNKAVTRLFRQFPKQLRSPALRARDTRSSAMRIMFSSVPAVLIRVDGEPSYQRVPGTTLERILNTTWPIVRDESGMHYLKLGDKWLEADDLMGSWSIAGMVPAGVDIATPERAAQSPGSALTSAGTGRPIRDVYVSFGPAELVITTGEPEYAPIRDTSLVQVRNTTTPVFKEPTDKELYVRVPNGWFRAWTTQGPWQPVAEDALPADLRNAVGSMPQR